MGQDKKTGRVEKASSKAFKDLFFSWIELNQLNLHGCMYVQ